MAANDGVWVPQAILVCEDSGAAIADNAYKVASSSLISANIDNRPYAFVKFKATDFTGAPTVGNTLALIERRTDGTDQEASVDANYRQHILKTWTLDAVDGTATIHDKVDIWPFGAQYIIYWKDGGSGTETLNAGWSLEFRPTTYGPSAS